MIVGTAAAEAEAEKLAACELQAGAWDEGGRSGWQDGWMEGFWLEAEAKTKGHGWLTGMRR